MHILLHLCDSKSGFITCFCELYSGRACRELSKDHEMIAFGRKRGIYLLVIACLAAFGFIGLRSRSVCLRQPLASSVVSKRRDAIESDGRRCSGDAWPEPSRPPQSPSASRCPRKVIFGNQRTWMNYVSSEFGFLFEALRVYHDWPYLSWFEAPSWDAVAEHFSSTFGKHCAFPEVLMFVETFQVLSRLNESAGTLRGAGTQM